MTGTSQPTAVATAPLAALALYLLASTALYAAPPIRTSETNRVPACVSPGRLMDFLKTRNPEVDARYRDIARWYKHWGEQYGVRWDYAFFQMALETNYLRYRRGDGRRGDVHEAQNNFAGIGATGGGVAGERFRDVKTGVQAQFEHLVAYSGERVGDPIARRTRENQDDIIAISRRLGRPVTYGDLARRWAADRQYAQSIDIVANLFRTGHCKGPIVAEAVPEPRPAIRLARSDLAPSALGGPKQQPQRLAGPETLPWTGDRPAVSPEISNARPTDPTPAVRSNAPETETREPKPKHAAPVKTLWSRRTPVAKTPDQITPPQEGSQADTSVAEPSRQVEIETAGPPVAPRATAHTPVPPSVRGDALTGSVSQPEGEKLPQFRIAPRLPEPSRLGGPLPGKIEDTAARSEKAETSAACRILAASYGGRKTLLVRAAAGNEVQYTALTVLDGFEKTMFETYAKAGRHELELVGQFASKDAALAEGHRLCPEPKT